MTQTTHTLTGLLLSRYVHSPLLLAPVALASHFALDGLPHKDLVFNTKPWLIFATFDNLVALGVYGWALHQDPRYWLPSTVGVVFATLPDLLFIPEILLGRPSIPVLRRFHAKVQKNHQAVGYLVEVAWAAIVASLLVASF